MVLQIIRAVLMLGIVPLMTGKAVHRFLAVGRGPATVYLTGFITELALIQIIAVPLIFLRTSFTAAVVSVSAALAALAGTGLILTVRQFRTGKTPRTAKPRAHRQFADYFALLLMAGGYVTVAVIIGQMTTRSPDDSRFVVSAVDMVRTDRMFLTNPATGLEIAGFYGDMHRDVVSPWAVYIAYTARTTGIYATTLAHSVLPQQLMFCMACCYWSIADTFFPDQLFSKCSIVFLAFLVNVYGYYSPYSAETFALKRIWQGKAVVASIGIPVTFWAYARIWQDGFSWKRCILSYLVLFSMCLMSGMGIIFSAILCAVFGIAYGITRKSFRTALQIWTGALIPVLYYGISQLEY